MAIITLAQPQKGQHISVTAVKGDNIALQFNPGDATLTKDGDNLVFSFGNDGTKIEITDFYKTYGKDSVPNFELGDQEVSGKDFFTAIGVENLMPAAGPAAAPAAPAVANGGGRYSDAGDSSLLNGINRLGGLDWGMNQNSATTDNLNGLGIADADAGATDHGVTLTPDSPFVPGNDITLINTGSEGGNANATITGAQDRILVNEAGLRNGGTAEAASSMMINAPDGVANIVIAGVTVYANGALVSGASIPTDEGHLTVTGFDARTGRLDYTYTLEKATQEHSRPGTDQIGHQLAVTVTDADGDTGTSAITVVITDDIPTANNDAGSVTEGAMTPVTGSVLPNDVYGADGPAPSGSLTWNDGADTAKYGSITLNPDGTYSYTLNNDNAAVKALSTNQTLTETFHYTIRDADGDTSQAVLTITIHGVDNGVVVTPTDAMAGDGIVNVNEANLPDGSAANEAALTKTGSLTVKAADGVSTISIAGTVVYANGTLTGNTTVNTDEGTLSVSGFNARTGELTYSYTLKQTAQSGEHTQQGTGVDHAIHPLDVLVTDADGSTGKGSITINVADDVPTAHDDRVSLEEGKAQSGTTDNTNVTGNDVFGADGAGTQKVVGVIAGKTSDSLTEHVGSAVHGTLGSLTLNGDGTYSYKLDDGVDIPNDGKEHTDTFSYTIRDADGDTSTATITVNVAANTVTPDIGGGVDGTGNTVLVDESRLTDGTKVQGVLSRDGTVGVNTHGEGGTASVTINGHTILLTLDTTDSMSLTAPLTASGKQGTLTITSVDHGTVHYTYTLNSPVKDDVNDGNTRNTIDNADNVTILVKDATGDSAEGKIHVSITDDIPVISVDAGGSSVPGTTSSFSCDFNKFDASSFSADGTITSTQNGHTIQVQVEGGSLGRTGTYKNGLTITPTVDNSGSAIASGEKHSGTDISAHDLQIGQITTGSASESVSFELGGLASSAHVTLGCLYDNAKEKEQVTVNLFHDGTLLGSYTVHGSALQGGVVKIAYENGTLVAMDTNGRNIELEGAALPAGTLIDKISIVPLSYPEGSSVSHSSFDTSDFTVTHIDATYVDSLTTSGTFGKFQFGADGPNANLQTAIQVTVTDSNDKDVPISGWQTPAVEKNNDGSYTVTETLANGTQLFTLTLIQKSDGTGTWSLTQNANAGVNLANASLKIALTDNDGDTQSASISGLAFGRTAPDVDTSVTAGVVDEAGLANGTQPGTSGHPTTTSGTFSIHGDVDTVTVGGKEYTISELEHSAATPLTLYISGNGTASAQKGNEDHATLVINGYDATTGLVSYTYTLTDNVRHINHFSQEDYMTASGADAIEITVSSGAQTDVAYLNIAIKDDAPRVSGRFAGLTDNQTADSNAVLTGTLNLQTGADEDGATVTIKVEGQVFNGTRSKDGTWSFTGDAHNSEGAAFSLGTDGKTFTYTRPAADVGNEGDTIAMQVTVTDSDGDTASATLTAFTIAAPTLAVPGPVITDEGNLSTGTASDNETAATLPYTNVGTGHIVIDTKGDAGTLTIDGKATFTITAGGILKHNGVEVTAASPVEISTGSHGTLTITGYDVSSHELTYSYELTSNVQSTTKENIPGRGDEQLADSFSLRLVTSGGSVDGTITAKAQDDAPVAVATVTSSSEISTTHNFAYSDVIDFENGTNKPGSDSSTLKLYGITISTATVKYDGTADHSFEITGDKPGTLFFKDESGKGTGYDGLGVKNSFSDDGISKDASFGSRSAEINYDLHQNTSEAIVFDLGGKLAYGLNINLHCFFGGEKEVALFTFYRNGKALESITVTNAATDHSGVYASTLTSFSSGFDKVVVSALENGNAQGKDNSDFNISSIQFVTQPETVLYNSIGQVTAKSADGITSYSFDTDAIQNLLGDGVTLELKSGVGGSTSGAQLTATTKGTSDILFIATIDASGHWGLNQYKTFSTVGNKAFALAFKVTDGDGDVSPTATTYVPINTGLATAISTTSLKTTAAQDVPVTADTNAGNTDSSGYVYGDAMNTDAVIAALGLESVLPYGSGHAVFEYLENHPEVDTSALGIGVPDHWSAANTLAYINTHADQLGWETVTHSVSDANGQTTSTVFDMDSNGNIHNTDGTLNTDHTAGQMTTGHTGNDQVLYGTSEVDHIYGQAGNDTIHGAEGNDFLYGGSGDDVLYGETGDDFLSGGTGSDSLYAGSGHDILIGDGLTGKETAIDQASGDIALLHDELTTFNPGDDPKSIREDAQTLGDELQGLETASGGNDRLFGGDGNDILIGGSGNDYLDGGSGNDVIFGGSGNDIIKYDASDLYVDGGSGIDFILGTNSIAKDGSMKNVEVALSNTSTVDKTNTAQVDVANLTDMNAISSDKTGITVNPDANTLTLTKAWSQSDSTDGGHTVTYTNEAANLTLTASVEDIKEDANMQVVLHVVSNGQA